MSVSENSGVADIAEFATVWVRAKERGNLVSGNREETADQYIE